MQLNFLWLSLILDLCRESMVGIAACLPIVLVRSVGFLVAATAATQTAYRARTPGGPPGVLAHLVSEHGTRPITFLPELPCVLV